jgi:hypothetical protein
MQTRKHTRKSRNSSRTTKTPAQPGSTGGQNGLKFVVRPTPGASVIKKEGDPPIIKG